MANITELISSLTLDSKNGKSKKFKKNGSYHNDRALKESNYTNGKVEHTQPIQKPFKNEISEKSRCNNDIRDLKSELKPRKKALSLDPEEREALESLIEEVIIEGCDDVVCDDTTTDEEKEIYKNHNDIYNNKNGLIKNNQHISKYNGYRGNGKSIPYRNSRNNGFDIPVYSNQDHWTNNGEIDDIKHMHNGGGDSNTNQLSNSDAHNVNVYPAQLKVAIKHMDILPPRFLRRLQASSLDNELTGSVGDNAGFEFFNSEDGREKLRGTLLNETKKSLRSLLDNGDHPHLNDHDGAYNAEVFRRNQYNFHSQAPNNCSKFIPSYPSPDNKNFMFLPNHISQNMSMSYRNNYPVDYCPDKQQTNTLPYYNQILNCSEVEDYLQQSNGNKMNDGVDADYSTSEYTNSPINNATEAEKYDESSFNNQVFNNYSSQNYPQMNGIMSPSLTIPYLPTYSNSSVPYMPNHNQMVSNAYMVQQTIISENGEMIPVNVLIDGSFAPAYAPENSMQYMPYYAQTEEYFDDYSANPPNWSEYDEYNASLYNPSYYYLKVVDNESLSQFEQDVFNMIQSGIPVIIAVLGSQNEHIFITINNLQNVWQGSYIKLNKLSKDAISYNDSKQWTLLQAKEAMLSSQNLIIVELSFSENIDEYEDYILLSQTYGYKLFVLEGLINQTLNELVTEEEEVLKEESVSEELLKTKDTSPDQLNNHITSEPIKDEIK